MATTTETPNVKLNESTKKINPKSAKHKVQDACVAVFNSHESAERAIKELQISGFDMKKLSIVGKGYETEENVMGYYNMGDRVKFWGGQGAFWGGVWGLFFSSAFMMIPGFGQVIIAGPFVSALIGVLEGAVVVGGLSSIGAALYSLGIPRNSVLRYEAAIKANKYLLAAHGTAEEVKKARSILENAGSNDVEAHIANPVH